MKIVPAQGYSTRLIREPSSDDIPLCELVIAGRPTGKVMQGAVFQAALQWHDYVLLFATDDVPFEEGLSIYLLDQRLSVVDRARMYFIYSPGIFSDLDLSEDDTVRFRFIGDCIWKLTLHSTKKFAIPILSKPLGVHRPLRFFRRFEITR